MNKRWVVKIGSQLIKSATTEELAHWMRQVSELNRNQIDVIWVSSGAIATAVAHTDFKKPKSDWSVAEKQALSSIGQPLLMEKYKSALASNQKQGAQILLSYTDFKGGDKISNFRNTIKELLNWKVLPIINENDAVATEEIKFGDNDALSAKAAITLKASKLIILTDVEGVFTGNPNTNPDAKLIPELNAVSSKLIRSAKSNDKNKISYGGMVTKLLAAKVCLRENIETVIVGGMANECLTRIHQKDWTLNCTVIKRKSKNKR